MNRRQKNKLNYASLMGMVMSMFDEPLQQPEGIRTRTHKTHPVQIAWFKADRLVKKKNNFRKRQKLQPILRSGPELLDIWTKVLYDMLIENPNLIEGCGLDPKEPVTQAQVNLAIHLFSTEKRSPR